MKLRVEGYKVVSAEHIGRPPLMSEEIVSLLVDHRGWLWVGEDAGVTVYDGQMWRSFTQDDGLIWNDTDSFAIYRRSRRKHVDRHLRRTESPDRAAERVSPDHRRLRQSRRLSLGPSRRNRWRIGEVEFERAHGIDGAALVQGYAGYRLFDTGWWANRIPAGKRRVS